MMQDLIKVIGAAILTAVCSSIIRSTKPELSFAVTLSGVIIILLFIFDMMKDSVGVLSEIVQMTGIENGIIRTLLKIVGIGYLVEFSAGVLNDFSAPNVADKVVIAGKITVIGLSMPIIRGLLVLFKQFIALL